MTARNAAGAALLALLAALPFFVGEYPVALAVEVLIFGVFVLGINLLVGYTGLVTLGHALFIGLGGYGLGVFAVLFEFPVWIAMALSLLVVAVVALAVGALCTRTTGVEFLLITLAFSEMFRGLAVKVQVTGGDDGMPGLSPPELAWLGLDSSDSTVFYYYVVAVSLLTLLTVWRVVNSPFGSVLVGIRENEKRMIALGYNVARYKIAAFTVSAVVSGVAGVLLAQKLRFVNPDIMTWQVSGEGLLMAIIGGRQAFLGPLAGAAFFILLKAELAAITEEYIIFFGLVFMLVVALFRGGLVGFAEALLKRRPAAG